MSAVLFWVLVATPLVAGLARAYASVEIPWLIAWASTFVAAVVASTREDVGSATQLAVLAILLAGLYVWNSVPREAAR